MAEDKKMELCRNRAGGIDLLVDRDGGNEVLILTGKIKELEERLYRLEEFTTIKCNGCGKTVSLSESFKDEYENRHCKACAEGRYWQT